SRPGDPRRQVAGRGDGPAPREAWAAGEELADRDLLPQGRDAPEPAACSRAADQRRRNARRREGPPSGIHHGLLRDADQLQRPVRRGGGPLPREQRRAMSPIGIRTESLRKVYTSPPPTAAGRGAAF